jgi:hypothetical protein
MIGGALGGAPTMTLVWLVGDERAEHLYTYLGRGRQATEELSPRVAGPAWSHRQTSKSNAKPTWEATRRLMELTTRPHSDAPSISD